jgi:hypothetical protein
MDCTSCKGPGDCQVNGMLSSRGWGILSTFLKRGRRNGAGEPSICHIPLFALSECARSSVLLFEWPIPPFFEALEGLVSVVILPPIPSIGCPWWPSRPALEGQVYGPRSRAVEVPAVEVPAIEPPAIEPPGGRRNLSDLSRAGHLDDLAFSGCCRTPGLSRSPLRLTPSS